MYKNFVALTITSLMLVAPAAHAVRTIDTDAFSLTVTETGWGPVEMTLLSNSDGIVRIGLDGMPSVPASVQSTDGKLQERVSFNWADFVATVQPDYQIYSISVTAKVTGSTALTPPADCGGCTTIPGRAQNKAHISSYWGNGISEANNVNGVEQLSYTHTMYMTGQGTFGINANVRAQAQATAQLVDGVYQYLPAYSSAALSDVVMTLVVTPPIPEPATYAMMLGGFGILALAARRRRV